MDDLQHLLNRLQQQFPFRFVDRVLDYDPGVSCRTLKNVSMNEKFFMGHFKGEPLLPGVLLIEMMAQTAALIADESEGVEAGVLAKVQQAKFLKTTSPGDQLTIEARLEGRFGSFQKFKGRVECEGELVASATIVVAARPS